MTSAMPFDQSAVISIIGAGGKTSLMFYLARVLQGSVITTTTTKVGYDQLKDADQLLTYEQFMGHPEQCFQVKVNWVSRVLDSAQRKVDGFSPLEFRWMTAVAQSLPLPVINEADGAHCRHIKAPSAFEPVIPEETTHVLSLVGLDVLGQPINDDVVHRLPLFTEITGTQQGMQITEKVIVAAYTHPMGGFKHAPATAGRIAVLNFADSEVRMLAGRRIAANLLSAGIDEVWLTSMKPGNQHILERLRNEEKDE